MDTLLYINGSPFCMAAIETLIRERQDAYYDALSKADKAADATLLLSFCCRSYMIRSMKYPKVSRASWM